MLRAPLFLPLLILAVCAVPAGGVTDEQVAEAIRRMRRYFYANQDAQSGGWPIVQYRHSQQRGGETALVVLALLASGETPQDPRLRRALEWLAEAQLEGTYAVALRAHVWAQLPDEYKPRLEADARWLLAAADAQSRFRYGQTREGEANLSTTHYGLLGAWEGAKRSVAIPEEFWRRAENEALATQWPDGGWGYRAGLPPYGSMTAAGVTALLIAQQQLHRRHVVAPPQTAQAIAAGLGWLDRHFDGPRNPQRGGDTLYYLYAIERIGLASGARYFNGQDWYRVGARYILERQVPDDGSPRAGAVVSDTHEQIDTAFALMFLSRGRVPVWASKLHLPDHSTNNRPNDLFFLTEFLSDLHEGELNYQSFSLDLPAGQWGSAPVAYLASDRAVTLTAAQKDNLKRFLDGGGLLLANGDNASQPFETSICALAAELYPQYPMRQLPPEHPLFSSLHPVAPGAQAVWGVSNGARDLILLPRRDWGFAFQAERPSPARAVQGTPWRLAANFWALATDRGNVANRLVERWETAVERAVTGHTSIGRARYEGNWLPEPAAWEPMAAHLFNRRGMVVETQDVALDEIDGSGLPLIHLAGTEALVLSDRQRQAIGRYIHGGGTLVVETVGGRGDFTRRLEPQLADIFNATAFQILGEEPMISGEGLQGGYDNRTVSFRRLALELGAAGRRPRLSAFVLDGRAAVVLSREDLSLGLLGVQRWGVLGYSPESARRLMSNIVLATAPAAPSTTTERQ